MFKYFHDMLSDGEQPSFGRNAAAVSLLFVLAWQTHVTMKTGQMPSLIECTFFVASLYAISKGTDVMQQIGVFKKGG
jgi:hypothetical protein